MAMFCTAEVDAGGQCDGDHVWFVRGPVASFRVFPRLAAVLVLQGFKGLSVFCHRESCKL